MKTTAAQAVASEHWNDASKHLDDMKSLARNRHVDHINDIMGKTDAKLGTSNHAAHDYLVNSAAAIKHAYRPAKVGHQAILNGLRGAAAKAIAKGKRDKDNNDAKAEQDSRHAEKEANDLDAIASAKAKEAIADYEQRQGSKKASCECQKCPCSSEKSAADGTASATVIEAEVEAEEKKENGGDKEVQGKFVGSMKAGSGSGGKYVVSEGKADNIEEEEQEEQEAQGGKQEEAVSNGSGYVPPIQMMAGGYAPFGMPFGGVPERPM